MNADMMSKDDCLSFKCSVSCGSGEMTREVKCVDGANSSLVLEETFCSFLSRPTDKETCITASCTSWQTDDWSEVKQNFKTRIL